MHFLRTVTNPQSALRATVLRLPLACLLALALLAGAACNSQEEPTDRIPTGAPATETPSTQEPTLPPTVNPGPAVFPPWQPDHLVARTADASVAVHKVVISEGLITLLYSIELAHADLHRTILVSPKAQLVGSRPKDALAPSVERILYHGVDASLGALSFEGLNLVVQQL